MRRFVLMAALLCSALTGPAFAAPIHTEQIRATDATGTMTMVTDISTAGGRDVPLGFGSAPIDTESIAAVTDTVKNLTDSIDGGPHFGAG